MAQTTTIETVTITRPLKLQNMDLKTEEMFVDRALFEQKISEVYTLQKGNRGMWDSNYMRRVKRTLKEGEVNLPRPPAYYHYKKFYELLNLDNEEFVILKRKSLSDPVIYLITMEEFYPKLLEAHVQTGHGGRDKMLHYIKKKWKIPRSAVELFPAMCETCAHKRTDPTKRVVVRPIVPERFNSKGQVDLIDFQSCPDNDYKWLMRYQDHATKFLQLRPLKSNETKCVAEELLKIFLTFGAPAILQSGHDGEFVANIIKELAASLPSCKIVRGKPRKSQSLGSVDRTTTADVEQILKARMITAETPDWARECYVLQWQKNTYKPRKSTRTPYEALLGPIKCGANSLSLPDDIINDLVTEDDLEKALDQLNENHPSEPDVILEDGVIGDEEMQELEPFAMEGIINGWFSRSDVQQSTDSLKIDENCKDTFPSVQEAVSSQSESQSLCDGQDLKKCNCRATGKPCSSRICSCFKANTKCNSGCHLTTTCTNT